MKIIKWIFDFPKRKIVPMVNYTAFKEQINEDIDWAVKTIWHFVKIQFLLLGVALVIAAVVQVIFLLRLICV